MYHLTENRVDDGEQMAVSGGEESVISYLNKVFWEDVLEESSHELQSGQFAKVTDSLVSNAFDKQMVKVLHALKVYEPRIGDFCARNVELFEVLHARKVRQSFICDGIRIKPDVLE